MRGLTCERPCPARLSLLAASLVMMLAGTVLASDAPEPLSSWQDVIRESPFWESQGVHENLGTIRRWVLSGSAYCEDESRHIFFDHRARFLGYMRDAEDPAATQRRINERRRELARTGRVEHWAPGQPGRIGYPFALSCTQPDARLERLLARYTGEDESAQLWGTWDGMRIGSEAAPVSLHAAIRQVHAERHAQGRISVPDRVLAMLAGKVIIESGGVQRARSPAGAIGIMQLSPDVLRDCEIDARFHFHRMAQIDCALRLLEQNHRNLAPHFEQRFGHLPAGKAEALYDRLLLQAYHGGVGRVAALLGDEVQGAAARYFAEHHESFTAGDIALGMVLHNLGRDRLGFDSLYYVTDVGIATDAACARLDDLPGCP